VVGCKAGNVICEFKVKYCIYDVGEGCRAGLTEATLSNLNRENLEAEGKGREGNKVMLPGSVVRSRMRWTYALLFYI
jgi:hypothetical protein